MITIVLVDDNDSFRKSVKRILTTAGYQVRDFSGPEPAIEHIRAHPEEASLLLVDGVMPRMAGPELAATVLSFRPQLPVLLMSGHPAPVFDKYFSSSDSHFISKPFVAADLIARIVALIGHAAPLPIL